MSQLANAIRDKYMHRLRRNLTENIIPFWYPDSVDTEHGGYLLSYDSDGAFAGDDSKMIVTQSRMVWFFSRLHREGYGSGEYLETATQGIKFLRDEMWDTKHGGFYWKVERDGQVKKPNKHLYGQSFALYALSEYFRTTGDDNTRELATDLFNLIEKHGKDHVHGGYIEYFDRGWNRIESGRTYLDNIEPDWSTKESSDEALDPTFKLTNTHLHLLEAYTTFVRAIGTEPSEDRLQELLHILTNTVVRQELTATTDKFSRKWVPQVDSEELQIVSYGHDLENIWLTMEACEALDISQDLFTDLYRAMFDYSLEYGYDDQHGGFYFFGPFNEVASNTIKAWWVQAECMTSALRMYDLTGDERYVDVFTETYDFVDEYQVDWETGEWHSGVDDELQHVGKKGAEYKAAYHNGRAMLECLSILESM